MFDRLEPLVIYGDTCHIRFTGFRGERVSQPSDSPKPDVESDEAARDRLIELLANDDLAAERLWRSLRPQITQEHPDIAEEIGRCISSLDYRAAIDLIKRLN